MVSIAESYGLRLLGPNCLGYVRPARNLNATFAHVMPEAGRVAFISQSGALGTAVLDWATANEVGFSAFVSVGSMCDVDFGDLIDYFGADPQTNSIILYIESLPDARKFMSAARHFAKTKPIIVVKIGPHGALGAGGRLAHRRDRRRRHASTARPSGAPASCASKRSRTCSTRARRCRASRARAGPCSASSPTPAGRASWPPTGCSPSAASSPSSAAETDTKLQECLPSFAARGNPVDVGGDADAERYAAAAAALMDDPNCDGVLAILTPQAMSHPTQTAEALIEVAKRHVRKPLLTSFMGEIKVAEGIRLLRTAHVPTFDTPEDAVRAYLYMYQYTKSLATLYETPADILPQFTPDRDRVKKIFLEVSRQERSTLTEIEAKDVLESYGIPVVKTVLATSAEECAKKAEEIGFPVAIKILSHDITHKSDVGGIALNVRSAPEAAKQFTNDHRARADGRARGQDPGRDRAGHVARRLRSDHRLAQATARSARPSCSAWAAPASSSTATWRSTFRRSTRRWPARMINDTKVSQLLRGYRGGTPVDMDALEQALVKVSYLLVDFPEIVEMDVNPLQVRPDGLNALDARIMIEPNDVRKITQPGSHLIISMYPTKYDWEHRLDGEKVRAARHPARRRERSGAR